MAELEGKVAFVTGAGSGIGRDTSLALASRGAFIWVTDFNKGAAEKTVELIEQAGGNAMALRLDVSNESEWIEAFETVGADARGLHILVNCAGKSIIGETFSMAVKDVRKILSVNVEGCFLGMKHAIPKIAQSGGGAAINISSALAMKGVARMAAYCGSKAAILMMTKAVALECAELRNNVRVNSVHPGIVDTPAWHQHGPDEVGALSESLSEGASALDANSVAQKVVPLGVACSSGEVAETICFLASDAARHITGAEIVIDGGMTAG
ncbi:MAG: SDR family NAD(P)-dependent oxidoreductase [Thermomicrobiales bacterium]